MTLTLLVLLLVPLNLFAAESGFARLSLAKGDVQVRIAESDDWLPAAANTPIYEGDSIWAPKGSRAEIQLRDGSVIRIDGRTALNVLQVESDFLQFSLEMGRAYIRTSAKRVWDMQFDLPESTVRVEDRGRYRLEIRRDGDEEISVFRGSAYVESYGSRTRVRRGEMLSLEDTGSEISPISPQDAWDRWNIDRDARQARRSADSEGMLPEELVVYEEELSSAGEWIVSREYGYVWRPTVMVSADWAPYREGRWIWRGGEYVWISHEPWGWAPYHYGRWAVVAGFGWCWVPPQRGDVYWGPGYVGWVTTPSHVGWVPLAPGDIYYGRGHYGRNSVNVTNVTNITTITINNRTNVYRNTVQQNAVTSVERNSFISGRGRYTRHSGDLFRKERVVAGRPEPRLESREIRMPQVRTVPADKLPPKTIVRVPVRELKEKYPRVDRGRNGNAVPRDERRQQPRETSRPGEQGRERTTPVTDPGAARGAERRQPLVKPVPAGPQPATRTPATVTPSPSTRAPAPQTAGEQKQRGMEMRERDTPSRPAEVSPAGGRRAAEPAQQQTRPQDVSGGDQRGRGTPRQDLPTQGQDRKEAQGRKDAGRKDGAAPPERKARGVWKIKPKEEAPREKEKEKAQEKEKEKK